MAGPAADAASLPSARGTAWEADVSHTETSLLSGASSSLGQQLRLEQQPQLHLGLDARPLRAQLPHHVIQNPMWPSQDYKNRLFILSQHDQPGSAVVRDGIFPDRIDPDLRHNIQCNASSCSTVDYIFKVALKDGARSEFFTK